ncbi:MAG: RagB/SusD family nutrient uptake outer membrane protein [Cyclobacteriaceae bacterium]
MKNNYKKTKAKVASLLTIVLLLGYTGCNDVLDEQLYSQVAVDDFYHTQDEANLALNGIYTRLWDDSYRDGQMISFGDVAGVTLIGGGSANGSGDRSAINTEWNTFSWTADANELFTAWERFFLAINRANFLLARLEEAPIAEDAKSSISGQAKFLRALFYFNLVRIFGGVPLYVNPTTDLSETDKTRSSEEEVYSQIITDLQQAVDEMSPYSSADHASGRATSAAATALLAKVYLQQRDWENAAIEAKKVIDLGAFSLFDDYENVTNPDFSNGSELIFSIQHGGNANATSGLYQTRMIYLFGPPQQTTPDGLTVQFHYLKDLVIFQVRQDIFNTTPETYRKWWSMRNQMPYYYTQGLNVFVDDTVQMYAPFVVKYHHLDAGSGLLREGVDFPLIRYSDVLLTYAEALNEANSGPTQEAYGAINLVRQRARGASTANEQPANVYPDLSGMNQAQFRDAILEERRGEFIGEGHYRWDLIRHDRLISYAQQHGISNAQNHHTLFPLPGIELSRNPNLEQNPGY